MSGLMPLNPVSPQKFGEESPEDQMKLGMRIVEAAFSSKVHALEQEIRTLRTINEEQRANNAALTKRNSALEVELVESHQRSQQLAEENKEMYKTVSGLRKQIGRLEHLKAAVMTSIQDDAEKEAAIGDTRALMNDDYLRSSMPLTSQSFGFQAPMAVAGIDTTGDGRANVVVSGIDRNRDGIPDMLQTNFAPPGVVPSLPNSVPYYRPMPSVMSLGNPSPPVVDGKEFFKRARGQLSAEVFNDFLQSIKRLNAQQQTREDTLQEAKRLFGPDKGMLYHDFEALLNRQGL